MSSVWHTNNRLRGTHWVLSPVLSRMILGLTRPNGWRWAHNRVLNFMDLGPFPRIFWGCAKGAEKAPRRELVMQNAQMDSNMSSINYKVFRFFQEQTLRGQRRKQTLQEHPFGRPFLPTRRLLRSFGTFRFSQENSGTKKRGFLEGGFAKMYASLGCGALSANCIAGPISLGIFCFRGRDTGLCRNPLC